MTAMELVDGFMEGLAVRHPLMPDWDVTEPQAEELAAFVMSLGSGAKADETRPPAASTCCAPTARAATPSMPTASRPNDKAPPFRDVVKKYDPDALEEALAEGIVTGHNNMPEFAFEPET